MNLLSIQSHVVYGHVGNSAAVFPLQRIGVEVWPIHTVQYSNHTGYGQWQGRVFDASLIRELVGGIDKRGVLAECDGVLSGYVGGADIGAAILEAVATVKRANPAAQYCCDPVIGDVGRGIYVREGVPEFMREKALPAADVITPNQFELDWLAGGESRTLAQAFVAIDALHARGPRTILVTSLHTEDTPEDAIDLVASGEQGRYLLRTPRLPVMVNGAGDTIAALFFAHYLRSGKIEEALAQAVSSVFGVLAKTAEVGAREMLLIEAQEEIVAPSRMFEAKPLGEPP
jgi:pyridoxine kinase